MSERRPVSETQWLAARQAREGQPPTTARIAAMLDVDVSAVYARAAAEGWRTMDFRSQEVLAAYRTLIELAAGIRAGNERQSDTEDAGEEDNDNGAPTAGPPGAAAYDEASPDFLANAAAFLSRQLTRQMARADRNGGRLDKAQIDSLISLSRMTERWEAVAAEKAKQDIKKSDDELAAILTRVNNRIVHLARELAARMVAEKLRSEGRETEGRLAQ